MKPFFETLGGVGVRMQHGPSNRVTTVYQELNSLKMMIKIWKLYSIVLL